MMLHFGGSRRCARIISVDSEPCRNLDAIQLMISLAKTVLDWCVSAKALSNVSVCPQEESVSFFAPRRELIHCKSPNDQNENEFEPDQPLDHHLTVPSPTRRYFCCLTAVRLQEFYLPRCVINLPAISGSPKVSNRVKTDLFNRPFRILKPVNHYAWTCATGLISWYAADE